MLMLECNFSNIQLDTFGESLQESSRNISLITLAKQNNQEEKNIPQPFSETEGIISKVQRQELQK